MGNIWFEYYQLQKTDKITNEEQENKSVKSLVLSCESEIGIAIKFELCLNENVNARNSLFA